MQSCSKVMDLSQPIYHNCPGWADYAPARISADYIRVKDGFNAETVQFNTHTGTHIDVPYHFFDDGKTIDQVSPELFMGTAAFLDLRYKEADSPIGVEDLKPLADQFKGAEIVVLNTGWGQKRGMTEEYYFKWPYLDGPGAQFLLAQKIRAVGCDTLSIGGWGSPEKGRPCHEALLGAGAIIIEEMLIPEAVMDKKQRLISFFPLLLKGCGGSPVRAVAYDI